MAFTMPDYPMLTARQASPFANLLQNAMESYQTGVKSRYAPQMIRADIFNKEFAPLAEIASSPLALAMMPNQRTQMTDLIGRLLQSMGSSNGDTGNMGMFSRSQGDQTGGNGYSMNGGQSYPSSGSQNTGGSVLSQGNENQSSMPGLPSTNLQEGAGQTAIAPYQKQLFGSGETFATDQGALTTPSGTTVGNAQDTLNAAANLRDLLPNYLEQAEEFTQPKGSFYERQKSSLSAMAHRAGIDNIGNFLSHDPALAGRWNNFQTEKNKLGVLLQRIYPTSTALEAYKRHADMLELHPDDTHKSFSSRVSQLLKDIDIASKNSKRAMNAGTSYNLNPESPTIYGIDNKSSKNPELKSDDNEGLVSIKSGDKAVKMKTPDGKIWRVPLGSINQAVQLGAVQAG